MSYRKPLSLVLTFGLLLAVCGSSFSESLSQDQQTPAALPSSILEVMSKSRYADSTWSLLVQDLETGRVYHELNADVLSFTGSTRKLFSVGMALSELGPEHRRRTTVHRQGDINAGVLNGDLVLVTDGDLTFGGRRLGKDRLQFTDLDHNEANSLGSAILTPQDPLFALKQLAADVKAAGIQELSGEVVVDDRLFDTYRVPNGNLLITAMMLNENQIDVTLTPTQAGQSAALVYRPETAFFKVTSMVNTGVPGSEETVEFSGDRLASGLAGTGTVEGNLPSDYVAPITGLNSFVGTFRVEDPNAFARAAFIEALQAEGVAVKASASSGNPRKLLPPTFAWSEETEIAEHLSEPYSEIAQLILKVSLNQGANLSLTLFGLSQDERTLQGALLAERQALVEDFGLEKESFDFPSNGSGSPDSKASPRALVQFLVKMSQGPVAETYRKALPILGEDGSLAGSGVGLPGQGHVFAKTGTTVAPDDQGQLQLVAENYAGYIDTKSGRKVAYALMLNNAGPLDDIEVVVEVSQDLATISSILYESL